MKKLNIPSIPKFLQLFIFSLGVLFSMTCVTNADKTSFTFENGWNLISTDVLMELEKDQSGFIKLLEAGAAVYSLNPIDKKYYGGSGSKAEIDASLQKMFEALSDGDDGVHAIGWWIYMPRSTSIDIDFGVQQDDIKDYQESYHFRKGWNLMGVSEVMINKSLDEIKGSCSIQSFYSFENAEGGWQKGSENNLHQKLTRGVLGRSFAVKMLEDCKFKFLKSVEPSSIPSIPE